MPEPLGSGNSSATPVLPCGGETLVCPVLARFVGLCGGVAVYGGGAGEPSALLVASPSRYDLALARRTKTHSRDSRRHRLHGGSDGASGSPAEVPESGQREQL